MEGIRKFELVAKFYLFLNVLGIKEDLQFKNKNSVNKNPFRFSACVLFILNPEPLGASLVSRSSMHSDYKGKGVGCDG